MERIAIEDEMFQINNLAYEMKAEANKMKEEMCHLKYNPNPNPNPNREKILEIFDKLRIMNAITDVLIDRKLELVDLYKKHQSGRTY